MNPKEFDDLARQYVALEEKADAADAEARRMKALVMEAVQKHGLVPPHAEQSRRLCGGEYVGTVTGGTTVEINDATVQELEIVLSRAKRSEIFPLLFARRVEYTLVKGAEHVIKQAKIPKRWRDHAAQLYAQCFNVKGKTPSLKIETLAKVIEREAKTMKKSKKKEACQ